MRAVVFIVSVLAVLGRFAAGHADPLPQPTGPVILELRGKIANTNADGIARFDLAMLQALGTVTVTTGTPWTDKPVRYDGVAGTTLLQAVGASGDVLVAKAINDYAVEVPVADLVDRGAFFAYAADGQRLTARGKGPVWLLYPFDSRADLKAETYYNRAIWQLKSIEIK